LDNLYWLDRIHPSERPLVGNQAFNLSQLLQRGYPVMPGFVVPAIASGTAQGAIAFWEFMEILGESEPMLTDLPHSSFHVEVDNPRQLQLVAQHIRQKIKAADLPPVWTSTLIAAAEVVQAPAMILRPSVSPRSTQLQVSKLKVEGSQELQVSKWNVESSNLQLSNLQLSNLQPSDLEPSGILESHTCLWQPEALVLSLKRVWAELFCARSLFYWQRNDIGLQQLNLAVLVQPLWDAIASGTLVVDPAEWSIQATWGFAQALTKGEVLPDSYQLEPETGTVKAQRLGRKTRAYRLCKEPDYSPLAESALQAYILSEKQQKQYALEEKYLKYLIDLAQQLVTQLGPVFSLEWTVCQTPESSEPKIHITRVMLQSRVVRFNPSPSTQPSIPTLVRGLPAAAGRVTAPAQVLNSENQNLEAVLPGRILVTQSIAPDWLPWLRQAVGVVTEEGGMTCHAAIIARELGIPAVVCAAGVTQMIQTGESLILDGDHGEIYRVNDLGSETDRSRQLNSYYALPPIATKLNINLSQPDSLERIVGLPVDGVGLLRSELMMLNALDNLHPDEWLRQGRSSELKARLTQLIIQFATALTPRPVFYRSLDWRSHEFQFLQGETSPQKPEVHPMLSLRGTLRYMSDPAYFDLELAALSQIYAYGYSNVHLMLPFVRTVEEFAFCRRRVEQAGLFDNPNFQLWIMAEVPSVLFLLPDYFKAGVQGISIGTNDLTQLLLAADRDRTQLGSALDARHPAVMRALKQLIQTARSAGIPCSICGQAPAQYPEIIDSLVEWGITSISVDVNDVERTYSVIARAEQRLLLEAARQKLIIKND
jgi:pyruvate,water dikinase